MLRPTSTSYAPRLPRGSMQTSNARYTIVSFVNSGRMKISYTSKPEKVYDDGDEKNQDSMDGQRIAVQ